MTDPKESAACLRIFGEDLVPDEITTLLGCPPTRSEKKGDLVGQKQKRMAHRGMWLLSVDREIRSKQS